MRVDEVPNQQHGGVRATGNFSALDEAQIFHNTFSDQVLVSEKLGDERPTLGGSECR